MTDDSTWKRCSTCKKPIAFDAMHFACSVSTCNRKGTEFAFCTVECWDAHVPVYRHRDAWAEERRAPATRQPEPPPRSASTPRPAATSAVAPSPAAGTSLRGDIPREVLVVISKLKAYVRARADMNTSDDVVDVLSDRLRTLCDRAIANAREAGRKTVMARDF